MRLLPNARAALPPDLNITALFDQSVFVKAAVQGVVREALIAAALTAAMILLFLGNWRSTCIIAISIPLSILSSLIALHALGQTINIMTLGGLALAVGILVDDATVTIENIERHLHMGTNLHDAILDGAGEIAVPALVSTLCICIVFVPMFFLTGVARYLFVPLAEAVVFAMLASYILSRTLVPTLAMLLMGHAHKPKAGASPNLFMRLYQRFDSGFERMRAAYIVILSSVLVRRGMFGSVFLGFCVVSMGLVFVLGEDFFPSVDAGDIRLHMRAPTGTRIEETARLADEVEKVIREVVPPKELGTILDNLGLPYSGINLSYSNAGTIGTLDGEIQVALERGPQADAKLYGQAARDPAAALSGRRVLLSAGRHRHADPELRPAGRGRRADFRRRSAGQLRRRAQAAETGADDSRHGRHAHPAETGRTGDQSSDGSHAPAATQSEREQRGAKRAHFAVGQFADFAGFLVQQQKRRRIQRRGADAAVPGFVDR